MANLRHYFMAANNMSTEDTSRIAAKKARAESKKMQYEKRLELEQKQELIRQRGRRTIKAGFSFMALGLCTRILENNTPASLANVTTCPTVKSFKWQCVCSICRLGKL